jgi:hypothetical protein
MDYKEHERTYNGFIKFVQIGSALIALLLVSMAIFLV